MARRTIFPALAVAMSGVLAACGQVRAEPVALEALVRDFYPGWTVQQGVEESCDRGAQPAVSGDFNGDGQPDHAARLVRGDRGLIVAFVSTRAGYSRIVLEEDSQQAILHQALDLVRRGSRHDIIQEDATIPRRPMVLANEAPAGGTCEASSYVYVIDGTRVTRAFTSD